jgi:integrase
MEKGLSPSGWNGFVSCIRAFYKWKNGGETYPECVAHVKLKRIRRLDYVAKKILSETEVKALLRAADNPRDRAIIAVAIATGARRGELLNIHLRDIEVLPYGFRIVLTGKTGTHKSPPVDREFAKILGVWLEHHPMRDNPDSPLWIHRNGPRQEAIKAVQIQNLLKKTVRASGLKRNIHWHMFRHTENTWATARGVSRASRNITHGWTAGSNTAAIYESLTDEDAAKEYERAHGIQVREEEKKDAFATVKCAYCGEENPASSKTCHFCYVPLDKEQAEQYLKRQKALDLISDPDVLEFLEKLIKQRKD